RTDVEVVRGRGRAPGRLSGGRHAKGEPRMAPCKVIMISAMYENGGNTTHRMLDRHPELFVYPYESQLGTSLVADHWTSFVPFKYRWPAFPLRGEPAHDYELIFDEQ